MDNATITRLLAFIADIYEIDRDTNSKMLPEPMKRYILNKFPSLSEAQVKHILRILQ